MDKFEIKFTLLDVPVPKRRIARGKEIIAAVSASTQNEPNQSIPRRSQELGIAQTTLWTRGEAAKLARRLNWHTLFFRK